MKSEWLEHRVQLNLALYQMDWKNSQLVLFDPVHLGNTTFVVNGPDYRVKGLEVQLVARVDRGADCARIECLEQLGADQRTLPDQRHTG